MTGSDARPPKAGLSPLALTDPHSVGPYRLLGRLGAGGMGIVYLGRAAGGRSVAVKVLRPDPVGDEEARQRFQREVEAASRVADEFTAPVLDASATDGDRVWMVTAFIPGLSLKESVEAYGPLPADSLRTLWYGLLQALRSVHEAGVVHRDVKPSNVMLTAHGPRLIDFGISMLADTGTTVTGTGYVVGTPSYMSPEHIEGRTVGPPADVFALGLVMAYAASGTSPFQGEEPLQAAYQVVYGKPELTGLPADLESEVRSCLAKDPSHRPRAAELMSRFPAEGIARAERQLEQGSWLPADIASASLARATSILNLDEPHRSPEPTTKLRALPSAVAGLASESLAPAAEPPGAEAPTIVVKHDAVPAQWAQPPAAPTPPPTALPQFALPRPAPGPAQGRALQPAAIPPPLPPRSAPSGPAPAADRPPPPDGAYGPHGADAMLTSVTPPLGADLPPMPRLGTRSRWRFRRRPARG